jgi:large subunit ribosomal protein L21
MKKAVIGIGSKQYIVSVGDHILIDHNLEKTLDLEPLMVIDDKDVKVGQPIVKGAKVSAKVVDELVKANKVTAIRYKAKKRVHKTRGHRQQHSRVEITAIS